LIVQLIPSLTPSFLAIALVAIFPAHSARALDVTVTGLRNATGHVVMCVWPPEDKGFPICGTGQPFNKLVVAATSPKGSIPDLPAGTYAVSMFHDEKRLGKPETNLIGVPKSGIGLANNPKLGMTNLPTFEQDRITIPKTKAVTLEAQYVL
jgi:uncharacterized protein (DUF2141 family)